MLIYVDIDNTICQTKGMDYELVTPNYENINKVNQLYDDGNEIIMWTARGTLSENNWFTITYKQLKQWNVKFHELRMGKPAYDLLIDDKALNSIWDWNSSSVNSIVNKLNQNNITILNRMIIIIQARVGSTRLPNKILLPFNNNKTIIDIITDRLFKNKYAIPVVVATTTNKKDDILYEKIKKNKNIYCFRGSENNVLDRFINCAETYNKEIIVRVCSDNPFISLEYLEKLIEEYIENLDKDYMTYTIDGIKPSIQSHIGIFTEIVKLESLKKIKNKTDQQLYIEHVTNYIYQYNDIFNIKLIKNNFNSDEVHKIRLTVDSDNDFQLISSLYDNIKDFSTDNVIKYILDNKNIIMKMDKIINENPK